MNTLATLYYSKTFTHGPLRGITVHEHITASPVTLQRLRKGTKGKDFTGNRYVISDASYQRYVRD